MKCPGKITKEKTDNFFDSFKNLGDKYDEFIESMWQKSTNKIRDLEQNLANKSDINVLNKKILLNTFIRMLNLIMNF